MEQICCMVIQWLRQIIKDNNEKTNKETTSDTEKTFSASQQETHDYDEKRNESW